MTRNFCANCGLQLSGNENFCASCGHQIGATTPQTSHGHHAKQPNNHVQDLVKRFEYSDNERHSEIVTVDDANGEPVVKFRNLHPNAIWLFSFQYLGKTAILPLLFLMSFYFEPILAAVALLVYMLAIFFVATLTYKNYEFEVSAVSFRKVYGIFHKYTVNIAFDQIQNINKRRSLIDQMLGLTHLEIETAGTGGTVKRSIAGLPTVSEGYIPGITPQEAEDVMQLMLARIQKN